MNVSQLRAGIYARYSSENQDERSIEDQLRLCREFAERRGDVIVQIFADYAISGASLRNRPEAARLIAAVRDGQIDCVITEALDRLSRDQEDVAHLHKRLQFAGVTLITVAEGEINELHVGLKGTMNALFLKDLAARSGGDSVVALRPVSARGVAPTAIEWSARSTTRARLNAACARLLQQKRQSCVASSTSIWRAKARAR